MTGITIKDLPRVLLKEVAQFLGQDLSFFARTSKFFYKAHWEWTSLRNVVITPQNMGSFIQYVNRSSQRQQEEHQEEEEEKTTPSASLALSQDFQICCKGLADDQLTTLLDALVRQRTGRVIGLNLESCAVAYHHMNQINQLGTLKFLNLRCCSQISDAGLRALAPLTALTSLNLRVRADHQCWA